MRIRLGMTTLGAAVALAAVPFSTPAAASGGTVSSTYTAQLGKAVQAQRATLGRESMWVRSSFSSAAKSLAVKALAGSNVTPPSDAAAIHGGSGSSIADANTAATDLINSLVSGMTSLADARNTDGGWAVATAPSNGGVLIYAVILAGAPAPTLSTASGTSANGFSWRGTGLHAHLPWTRNKVKFYLSTSTLPSAGESIVKTALARLNAVPGLGADIVYAGKTTATKPDSSHHFVVVFATTSNCGSTAWGCSEWTAIGRNQITDSRIVLYSQRYATNPTFETWVGIASHEIGHTLGLGHYDQLYLGKPQLMRSYTSTDNTRAADGDKYGLKRLNPAGALATTLKMPAAVADGATVTATVYTRSAGLGGVRSYRVDCTDATGVYRTMKKVTGAFDIRGKNRSVSFTVHAATPYVGKCRSVVTNKVAWKTSASRTVAFG